MNQDDDKIEEQSVDDISESADASETDGLPQAQNPIETSPVLEPEQSTTVELEEPELEESAESKALGDTEAQTAAEPSTAAIEEQSGVEQKTTPSSGTEALQLSTDTPTTSGALEAETAEEQRDALAEGVDQTIGQVSEAVSAESGSDDQSSIKDSEPEMHQKQEAELKQEAEPKTFQSEIQAFFRDLKGGR